MSTVCTSVGADKRSNYFPVVLFIYRDNYRMGHILNGSTPVCYIR